MNYIQPRLTVVFDTLDTRLEAQSMLSKKLSAFGEAKTDFTISRLGLVQWSDPITNESTVYPKNDKEYFRYTAVIECSYKSEDDYVKVQDDFVGLFKNDTDLFFNIQNIDTYMNKIVEVSDTTSDTEVTA